MATDNCVTQLMNKGDFNVMLTVFDNSHTKPQRKKKELYTAWFETVRRCLGNCIFRNPFGILYISTDSNILGPLGATSTQDVLKFIRQYFEEPKTFRLDITTPNETTISWIIALSEDLN